MTVIKPEYISEDINIHDVLPLSFLKKSVYTGSKGGMRFRMEKAEIPEAEEGTEGPEAEAGAGVPGNVVSEIPMKTVLLVSVWPEPYAYDHTEKEQIKTETFAFSKEGIEDALVWLNRERVSFRKTNT